MREAKRIEDIYLNYLRRSGIGVRFILSDGRSVQAVIVAFDQNAIVIDAAGTQQLIYKTSIIQIEPNETVSYIFNDKYLPNHSYAGTPYPPNYA